MKRLRANMKAVALHACLITALWLLPACSSSNDLMGPDVPGTFDPEATVDVLKECPTFDEACEKMGALLYESCSLSKTTDPGDLALCKFYAFNDLYRLLGFNTCFNANERLALYDCAKMWEPAPEPLPLPDPDGGTGRLAPGQKKPGEPVRPETEPIHADV